MIKMIKKWWVRAFTNNPWRVVPFEKLYPGISGQPLDLPETLNGILCREQGAVIDYVPPPHPLNSELQLRFINGKPRYLGGGLFKEPDRFIFSLGRAGIIGQLGLAYAIDKRSFIDESAKEWTRRLDRSAYVGALNLPERKRLAGISFSFLTIGAEAGYYHFLFESIPKAGLFGTMLSRADHLLFNGPATDWKLKWLRKAGIDTTKIIWMDGASHYECEQLVFTSRLIADQQISAWCLGTLSKLFGLSAGLPPATSPRKVILISRKGLGKREISWESEILNAFPEIEKVDFSALGPDETIHKLRNTTHIIGPHGAGLSNIYLCRPGTKVMEIYPEKVTYQPCYQRISALCRLEYVLMYLNFHDASDPQTGFKAFDQALNLFLGDSPV
ncbi:DUF563 domain-containing protein [Mucilaginibacter angelicae]|uniref:DUF563 domain-containing protein n=1 Tax=Mucilaginibacter angelicae TaxID=869718 RepID=A0ABV6L519_9SPHI